MKPKFVQLFEDYDYESDDANSLRELGLLLTSKEDIARKFVNELESRNLGPTFLSNEKQLKNGNIFFEWRGISAKPLIQAMLSDYSIPPGFIIDNMHGDKFIDTVNTGTIYQFSGDGFMKHNTGPSKKEFGISNTAIANAVNWCTENAKVYILQQIFDGGYTTYLTSKRPSTPGIDIKLFNTVANETGLDAIHQYKNDRPEFYDLVSHKILAYAAVCKVRGSELDRMRFYNSAVEFYGRLNLPHLNNSEYLGIYYKTSISSTKKTFTAKLEETNLYWAKPSELKMIAAIEDHPDKVDALIQMHERGLLG
jgi:hypothetical protein